MIDLLHTVFLVDGQTEIDSIRQKIQKDFGITTFFRKVGCNGKNVTPEGYSSKAAPILFEAMNSSFTSIICILDREERSLAATALEDAVKKELIAKMASYSSINISDLESKLSVCVTDIMFENWILADIEGIKEKRDLIKSTAIQEFYDGRNGSSLLKNIMHVNYKKIFHSVTLFKAVRFNVAKDNSPSFNRLYDSLCNDIQESLSIKA
jgi:hypothetical protein